MKIYIWQRIVSPHMASLARALVKQGCEVVYLAEQTITPEREAQGWNTPDLGGAFLLIISNKKQAKEKALAAPVDAIHISQGVRGNGVLGSVQKILSRLSRTQYVVMETVDDAGMRGAVKRLLYKWKFSQLAPHISGVLAIGKNTPNWVVERGIPKEKVFAFAYFLPTDEKDYSRFKVTEDVFTIIFVGRFIPLKRLELLITVLEQLKQYPFKLVIVGTGPLEKELNARALKTLEDRIKWIGKLPMDKVRVQMASADCLVLPSRYDGWGAVVSESLMSGTPVICSDKCGASVAVKASGYGHIFESDNVESLKRKLESEFKKGKVSRMEAKKISRWAQCLGEDAGARYLLDIFESVPCGHEATCPPWDNLKR